jgi:hypothetical protein
MGTTVILYLQLLLQGMASGELHDIGLFVQGELIVWDEGVNNVKERSPEKAIKIHLGLSFVYGYLTKLSVVQNTALNW